MDGNVQFTGSPMGDCEPYEECTAHVTVVRVLADLTSKLIDSATIDGHPNRTLSTQERR